ncbi:MAG: lytic transglycosylase domain-containing protein [Oricola sp.]
MILPLQLDAKPTDRFERIEPPHAAPVDVQKICDLISASANETGLPAPFLARLIWKESRFDPGAVARTGEQGIAQLLPGIAFKRGVRDAFDPEEAIPALAKYLAELRDQHGNIGMAATAWETGDRKFSQWYEKGGYLPIRTEDYILAVLGELPLVYRGAPAAAVTVKPLEEGRSFDQSCRAIPSLGDAILLGDIDRPAWGAQLAGNFNRNKAIAQWELLQQAYPALLGNLEPSIFTARTHIGRNRMYVVQVGAESQAQAEAFCAKVRAQGGACLTVRN